MLSGSGQTEENSFNKLKKLATEAPVLRFYDPTLPLTLSVDSSSTGLGCVIMQEGQPIAYASRALTKTHQNYAQIEKETLAVVFGCEKFHQFVYGRTVETPAQTTDPCSQSSTKHYIKRQRDSNAFCCNYRSMTCK